MLLQLLNLSQLGTFELLLQHLLLLLDLELHLELLKLRWRLRLLHLLAGGLDGLHARCIGHRLEGEDRAGLSRLHCRASLLLCCFVPLEHLEALLILLEFFRLNEEIPVDHRHEKALKLVYVGQGNTADLGYELVGVVGIVEHL